jgi:hypothetical protein
MEMNQFNRADCASDAKRRDGHNEKNAGRVGCSQIEQLFPLCRHNLGQPTGDVLCAQWTIVRHS